MTLLTADLFEKNMQCLFFFDCPGQKERKKEREKELDFFERKSPIRSCVYYYYFCFFMLGMWMKISQIHALS